MAKEDDETFLIIDEKGKSAREFGFTGKKIGEGKFRAPLSHENAVILRRLFPFTAPVRGLKKPVSFGLGDRLGIATLGHIDLFKDKEVFPFFAQQSIRELNLTNRTYEDVLDATAFAVFREGYKKGFGADGDHLKTTKDIEYALSLGFSMITLDCSDHINNDVTPSNVLPADKKYIEKYKDKNFDIGDGYNLAFTENEINQCAAIYEKAINFAADIYNSFFKNSKYEADLEISIDETVSVTTPLQHYFVASELLNAGVSFATIAPRFCGEFQKGIDYIGDISQFEREIKIHAAIARHFEYKLSIHSGSDKFNVFPIIGKECRGIFHVKTAGTNWLEAMRITAKTDPGMYREVHDFAHNSFTEAKKFYHITTDLSLMPDITKLKDEELVSLFENNDVRQMIHITYGQILEAKNSDGSYAYKNRLYRLWKDNEDEYRKALVKHIGKHLELLGV